jgi:hypothetical protein
MHDLGQPQPGDLMDLREGRTGLIVWRISQPAPKRLQDGLSIVEARADDEGESESLEVSGVELVELGGFLLGEAVEAGALLFV